MTIKTGKFIEEITHDFETVKKTLRVFEGLDSICQDNISHKGYSVFEHTRKVFFNGIFFVDFIETSLNKKLHLTDRTRDIFLLKCLIHDIGKINTGVYIDGEKYL